MAPETEGVASVLQDLARWARARPDVRGMAVVGSCARDQMHPDSDVDIVIITDDADRYAAATDWADGIPAGAHLRTRRWGALVEQRFRHPSGLELDIGIAETSWAATDPVDAGTREVVRNGFRPLHDPDGLLARLVAASG